MSETVTAVEPDASGPHFCIACGLEVQSDLCLQGKHEGKLVAVSHETAEKVRCTGIDQPVLSHPRVMGHKEPGYLLVS